MGKATEKERSHGLARMIPLPPLARQIWRAIAARPRQLIGLAAGLGIAPFLPQSLTAMTSTILAWDFGVIVYLVATVTLFTTERVERIAEHAEAQEEGEWTIFALTLAAVAFSFAAVVNAFTGMKGMPDEEKGLHLALVGTTLVSSWLMTHVTFAFRYAHEFYAKGLSGSDYDRGLDFPDEPHPDYLDFLYFALVLGMTFQVSDVRVTGRKFRRLATVHGMISFLFNTIIVALTVNLAGGMVS